MPGGRPTYPLLLSWPCTSQAYPGATRVTAGQCWPNNCADAKSRGTDHIVDPPAPDAGWLPAPAASPPDRHAGRLALVGMPGVVLTGGCPERCCQLVQTAGVERCTGQRMPPTLG